MDPTMLLPAFGNLLTTVAAFIVALSVIVAIHEYGHYIVGRWSGIKAEVFSLGFGPVVFSRVDRHGTRWQIAALPLGGYVKFLGDSNAASAQTGGELEAIAPELRRQTMLGAPLWARAATVAAGPVFNFILSFLIFAAVMMIDGRTAEPLQVGALRTLPVSGVELQPGDQIVAIAGQRLEDGRLPKLADLPRTPLVDYTVAREGGERDVAGPYPMPALIGSLVPRSAAADIDLRPGDVITGVDGSDVVSFGDFKSAVEASNGRVLQLQVWRDGQTFEFALAPRRVDEPLPDGGFATQWRVGIIGDLAFVPARETLGPGAAVSGAVKQVWGIITSSVSGLYYMITGAISSCNISGPIGIAEASGTMASQGAQNYIWFVGVLSTAIGLLNLFPIPVLDGGHLVFFAYEAVRGKPPGDAALRVLMTLGLALILSLMLFAVGNDLFFCP